MHMMRYSGALLIVCLLSSSAMGGLLTSDTAAFNDGMTLWRGTQNFSQLGLLDANVDYAVYAPGMFHASTALGNPPDPSNGHQYVYAYQVWNDVGGVYPIGALSVGFADALDPDRGDESPNKLVTNIGILPPGMPYPDGVAPSNYVFNGVPAGSAVWNYGTPLPVGGHSSILLYTSPYGPETDYGSISGGPGDSERLPSPVPEPASVLLLGIAATVLAGFRLFARRG
jgi:hypothetical protein